MKGSMMRFILLWAFVLWASVPGWAIAQVIEPGEALKIVREAFAAKLADGRPMEQTCNLLIPQTPVFETLLKPYRDRQAAIENGASRFPIRRCSYNQDGFTAEVIMMNPDAEQIARWVVSACQASRRVATGELGFERCLVSAAREIWLQANAQFPISGLVVEDIDCDGPRSTQWGFRHGATVRLEGMPKADEESQPAGVCQSPPADVPRLCTAAKIDDPGLRESLLTAPVVETAALAYARLSNLSRTSVFQGNAGRCPRPGGGQPEWLDRSRDGYLAALGSDDYPMLTQWIDSDRAVLEPGNRFGCARLDAMLLGKCPAP
jgi:hypothetical protein